MLALIFVSVFAVHFLSRISSSHDSSWAIYVSMSLIREGNVDLDEYRELIEKNGRKAVEEIDGRLLSIFPLGTPLAAVPFVFAADRFFYRSLAVDLHEIMQSEIPAGVETLIASFIVALAALFIYLIARLHLSETGKALVLVFVFAFCTSAWSTASRALWQHGPSMLMLCISLYLVLLAGKRPWMIQFAGLTLAFSYVIRPTNGISLLLFTLYVILAFRRYLIPYLLWGIAVLIPFLLFNFSVYHSFLSPYYSVKRLCSNPHFLEALAGNLISPGRGLLLYSPVLLLSIYGIILKVRGNTFKRLDSILVATLVLHWLSISAFKHWWGGHSFGPRLLSDMVPFFIYFLIPVVEGLPRRRARGKALLICAFVILTAVSFFIHCRGANSYAAYAWNNKPVDVDQSPARIWDYTDIQFLRGIR